MKKTTALIVALLFCFSLGATDVLNSFLSKLDSLRISFDYSFEVKGSVPLTGQGSVIMQGESYILKTEGLRVWSNASVRCMADDVTRELYLESVGKDDFNTNPMLALKTIDKASILKSRSVLFNGQRAQSFVIRPSAESNFKSITAFFSGDCVVGLELVDASDVRTVFIVTNMVFHSEKFPDSAFIYKASEFKEYQIIDMLSD